jgi:hypothetical protein
MPKSDLTYTDGYAPVAERVRLFYERYPTGRIITELVSRTPQDVVFKATVFRTTSEQTPAATGWAAEREGDGDINTVACLENTETSAVGRALANLGLTASRERPSAEEMLKAARAHARVARQATAITGPAALRVAEPNATAASRPVRGEPEPVSAAHARPRSPERARDAGPPSVAIAGASYSSVVDDIRVLLVAAASAGIRPARVAAWRARLSAERHPVDELMHVERWLRGWLAEHDGEHGG